MLPLLFTALAVLVLAPVLLPLLRGGRAPASRGSYDRAVYRDQLSELDRDLARGLITGTEAASARLEIQRRLLATEEAADASAEDLRRLSRSPALAVVLALLVAGGASAMYLLLGAPGVPDVPFASRAGDAGTALAGETGRKAIEDAADGLATRLASNPDDGRGWVLYGRTEAMLSNWDKAAEAFERGMKLGENGPEVRAGYGEMLVMQAGGVVTPAARDAFAAVLKADPGSDVARYYLALAAGQAGDPRGAIAGWQALAADLPTDSPMRPELANRITEMAAQNGLPAPALAAGKPPSAPASDNALGGPAAGKSSASTAGTGASGGRSSGTGTASAGLGPDAQAMASAATMPEADRKAMIAGMVSRLAARMAENPSDVDGWMRLGRAYAVMGDRAKSVEAYDRALSLKPDNPEIKLMAVEAMLTGLPPSDPFPPRAIRLLRDVQLVEPDQPAVLWYLGLQAARDGHRDEARSYWTRLLAKMPAGQDADMVRSALEQVKGS